MLSDAASRAAPFKLRELLALLKKLAALVTVLLRRFFSLAGTWSSLCRRLKNPAPGGEKRLSRGLAFSGWTLRALVSMPGTEVGSVLISLGGLEEPLNILFSKPPCEEKLRRLFPASLIVSFFEDEMIDNQVRTAGSGVTERRYSGLT